MTYFVFHLVNLDKLFISYESNVYQFTKNSEIECQKKKSQNW